MMKTHRRGIRIAVLALAVIALGLAAAPAFAGGRQAVSNGLQVAIDANGNLRQPTAAESRVLAMPFTAKALSAPQFTAWADGTISMVLTPDYLNVWLVGLNADGSANQVCVDGYNAATVQPAPALEEK
jgi:hypothetical protein